jgi:hypothetical protein
MTDTAQVSRERPEDQPGLVDAEQADQLLARAEARGVELLGPDGLLSHMTTSGTRQRAWQWRLARASRRCSGCWGTRARR